MTTDVETLEVVPEASRIMEGMRDTGYEFNTAIADIVDNSIAADASEIRIKIAQRLDGNIRVSISDNGSGMDREGLINAMRYGAEKRHDIHSLGKFGLGLKTASTSCCRRLKVCSRDQAGSEPICVVWDLDAIALIGKWMLRFEDATQEDLRELNSCAAQSSGTVVVWEKCDRLLSARYSNPSTPAFKKALTRAIDSLKFHLSMTFQRFLDSDDRRVQNISIYVNGEKLAPWDPFCKELRESYGRDSFVVKSGEINSAIEVSAYIVPQKNDYVTVEEQQRIMPSYKNEALQGYSEESMSGFYVYREGRLIHWGDWFNMPGVDFHSKLCRFELSFNAELDEVFQVDIKKSRILLSDELRKTLTDFASPFKKEGEKMYRKKATKASEEAAKPLHGDSNTSITSIEPALVAPDSVVAVSETEAEIKNRFGVIVTSYNIRNDEVNTKEVVETVDSLEDGLLWAPALLNGRRGVQLNANHEFYKRFYASNSDNAAAIQAMDYVFYSLAQAETDAIAIEAQENLREARYFATKNLRKLAKFLPDVSLEDIEGADL